MSANILRRAAASIRADVKAIPEQTPLKIRVKAVALNSRTYLTVDPTIALALANWLDTAGADIWAHGPLCECTTGCDACDDNLWEPHARAALAIANTYLGGGA